MEKKEKSLPKEEYFVGFNISSFVRSARVLVIGLGQQGLEIAKNMALMNINTLGLCDKQKVSSSDLKQVHIFPQSSLDTPRITAARTWIKSMTPSINLKEHEISPVEIDQVLKFYDLVYLTDVCSYQIVEKVDELCLKSNKKLIFVGSIGDFGWAFFNLIFIKISERFAYPEVYSIEKITNASHGLVTLTQPHSLMRGDFVSIEDVKGMNGIFPDEIRPVVRVVDDYSFEIEDTTNYSPYVSGGVVKGTNYVRKINYKSIISQFEQPNFNQNYPASVYSEYHMVFILLLKVVDIIEGPVENNFKSSMKVDGLKFDEARVTDLSILSGGKNEDLYYSDILLDASEVMNTSVSKFDQAFDIAVSQLASESGPKTKLKAFFSNNYIPAQNNSIKKQVKYLFNLREETNKFRIMPYLMSSIAANEMLKITGVNLPFRQTLYVNLTTFDEGKTAKLGKEDIFTPLSKKLLVIGAGGRAQEFLKLLLIKAHYSNSKLFVDIYDENRITEKSLKSNFFLTSSTIGGKKSEKLASVINGLQNLVQVTPIAEEDLNKSIKEVEMMVICTDNIQRLISSAEKGVYKNLRVFLLLYYSGNCRVIQINQKNLAELPSYFADRVIASRVLFEGIDIPTNAQQVAKWTNWLFELTFEQFFLENSFFVNANSVSPFYYLILLLKSEIYLFLCGSYKFVDVVTLSLLFFKIIFNWYIVQIDPKKKPIEFNDKDQLHRDFCISFCSFFALAYMKVTTIDEKVITDALSHAKKHPLELKNITNKKIEGQFISSLELFNRGAMENKTFAGLRFDPKLQEYISNFAFSLYCLKLSVFDIEAGFADQFYPVFFAGILPDPQRNNLLASMAIYEFLLGGKMQHDFLVNLLNTQIKLDEI